MTQMSVSLLFAPEASVAGDDEEESEREDEENARVERDWLVF